MDHSGTPTSAADVKQLVQPNHHTKLGARSVCPQFRLERDITRDLAGLYSGDILHE
jgi:hypothetical protein